MTVVKKRLRPKKYSEIAEVIRKRVTSGDYKELLPGINQLAEEFDVNRKTTNRAILHLVKEGLLVRRAGFGTFVAGNDIATETSTIKRVNSKRYAVLIRSTDPFPGYLELLSGCDEVISGIGGSLIYTKFDEHALDSLLGRLRFQQIEGVIVCGLIANSFLRKLQQEFSVLLIDSTPNAVPTNAIIWNYYESAFQLGNYLAKSGKKRVALTNFIDDSYPYHTKKSFPYRLLGFRDAFKKNQLDFKVFDSDWALSAFTPKSSLCDYLYKAPADTVLISSILPQVLNKLDCYDLIGKLKLSGYGDEMSIKQNSITGTYISENYREMGKCAGETIIDILGRPRLQLQTRVLKGELIDGTIS